jgi:hypothetical protein
MTLTKATIKRLELKGNQKHDDWLKDWAKTIDEIRKQVKERAVLIVNQDKEEGLDLIFDEQIGYRWILAECLVPVVEN